MSTGLQDCCHCNGSDIPLPEHMANYRSKFALMEQLVWMWGSQGAFENVSGNTRVDCQHHGGCLGTCEWTVSIAMGAWEHASGLSASRWVLGIGRRACIGLKKS